jgi:hypothetical protein
MTHGSHDTLADTAGSTAAHAAWHGYWVWLGLAWMTLGLAADLWDPWVAGGLTLGFGAVHAALLPRLALGTGDPASNRDGACAGSESSWPSLPAPWSSPSRCTRMGLTTRVPLRG